MPQNTGEIQWLINQLNQNQGRDLNKNVPKIKLNQLASKLGFFYEKIRNVSDYKEEHLIRRESLKRLINRQIKFLGERDPLKISQTVIFEFIRAKYLPNGVLPETDIEDTAVIIAKYLIIIKFIAKNPLPKKIQLVDWFIGLLACEIDDFLFPAKHEKAITGFMYGEMIKSVVFAKNHISETERNIQLYIATLKNLLKADNDLICYHLLKLYKPNWQKLSPKEVKAFCEQIPELKTKIDNHLYHYSSYQLSLMLRSQAVFFDILKELLETNRDKIKEIIEDEKKLEETIEAIANNNYQKVRNKLLTSIIRVIIFILATKVAFTFIMELPYAKLIKDQTTWQTLIVNTTFHPVFMAFIALTIRVPAQKNTRVIIEQVKKIIYGQERKLVYKPRKILKRGGFAFWFLNLIYLIMFSLSFGVIAWVLYKINFSLISGIIFILYLTIISFFAFRLKNFANKYLVLPRKENLRNLLIDFFTIPLIRAGKSLSEYFSKINIFIYVLDFLIETPFKKAVEGIDAAISYIGEKREEIE